MPGEDWIVTCSTCDYRANLEKATSALETVEDGEPVDLERFPTPGLRTIKALAEAHPDIASPERQIKTLVYLLDSEPTLILLRGDHDLQEQKLLDQTGASEDGTRPAHPDEIRALLGADAGSLGGVGVEGVKILADEALRGRLNMTTGANEDDWHFKGVDVERDIEVTTWGDFREVKEGDRCQVDGGELDLWKGIEVGHIFKLGTMYSEAFGATVQDEAGVSHPIIMGSYGIGVERNVAAVVEANHDDKGIVWPVAVAPYEVVITVVRPDDGATLSKAEDLYSRLVADGIDVILDDRVERPGVKFADAELVGIPFRITVGPRGLESGEIELTTRNGLSTEAVAFEQVADQVTSLVRNAKIGD